MQFIKSFEHETINLLEDRGAYYCPKWSYFIGSMLQEMSEPEPVWRIVRGQPVIYLARLLVTSVNLSQLSKVILYSFLWKRTMPKPSRSLS